MQSISSTMDSDVDQNAPITLPVFGSRISGERCDGGVPGEKCSLL